jgi:hypothetical protein
MCSLGGTCTECETCETIPNHPGLSSTILAHLGVNVFLGCAPNVRHVRPSQLSWTVSTILAHLWCKCVPWEVHAPNVRHVRPSPTILDCLNYPGTFGYVFLVVHAPNVETCETIPNYPGLSSTILAHLWCKCVPWMVHARM